MRTPLFRGALAATAACLFPCAHPAPFSPREAANSYLSLALESLVREPSTFEPGRSWDRKVGQFPSWIHVNFNGDPEMAALRNGFRIYDENMFCTAWVAELLIAAQRFGVFEVAEEVRAWFFFFFFFFFFLPHLCHSTR
jgi:hypothetical protein